jgi:hypothetical protein
LHELKAGLRKVRNKIAAQVSRERKQVYVTDLEARVEHVTILNMGLQDRVVSLERENKSLLQQLRELQQRCGLQKTAHTGTCLMLLGLCFALCASPAGLYPAPAATPATLPLSGHFQHGRALKSMSAQTDMVPASTLYAVLWQAVFFETNASGAWVDEDDDLSKLRQRVLPLRFRV